MSVNYQLEVLRQHDIHLAHFLYLICDGTLTWHKMRSCFAYFKLETKLKVWGLASHTGVGEEVRQAMLSLYTEEDFIKAKF